MKFYFGKRVILSFIAALTTIIWLGVYSFLNNRKFAKTSKLVSHTIEVLYHSEQLLTMIIEMESNQRGYAITGDENFLTPLQKTSEVVIKHVQVLQALTNDNAGQQKRLKVLQPLIVKKVGQVKTTLDIRRMDLKSQDAQLLTSEIKQKIAELQREEETLLTQRIKTMERDFSKFNVTFSVLLATTDIILLIVFIAIYWTSKARFKSTLALNTASLEIKDLYENAPCGYHSLNDAGVFVNMNRTLLSWLGYTKDEVVDKLRFDAIITPEGENIFKTNFPQFKERGYVYNLEFEFIRKDGSTFPVILNSTAISDSNGQYLKSRSTVFDLTENKRTENKIKLLNKELEAFTYSVSHDLRSPLRSIDGYAKILEEDYSSRLDDEGKRLMRVIMNNATRMGRLIDDLLDFSRIGRKELVKTEYDAAKLINAIVRELTEQESERDIQFIIHDLPSAHADSMLMRQVWVNLISNAIKYTRRVKEARIEIGSWIEKNEIGYFIKDNGAGFEMAYVHKLFGVFQRLHKIQDFEGTGVGLAIVYRIISKHGGRVWAESKVNEGATFSFTLPKIKSSYE